MLLRSFLRLFALILALVPTLVATAQTDSDEPLTPSIPLPAYGVPIERAREVLSYDGSVVSLVECTDRDAGSIVGLHRTLRAIKNNGHVQNTFKGWGAFQRIRTDVDECSPIDYRNAPLASFHNSWHAVVDLHYWFHLKRRTAWGVEMSGGQASVVDSVNTSALRRRLTVYINWDALCKDLWVTVTDYDNPYDTGVQLESGRMFVTGRSTLSTVSKSTSVNSNYSIEAPKTEKPVPTKEGTKPVPEQKISISGTFEQVDTRKRLVARVSGASYHANFGRFTATEVRLANASLMEFGFGANWLSDSMLSYDEVADWQIAECKAKK
ncbi:MAG TPA: hypothetical protein PLV92_17240, partial [Pirellulaceae bacterium]|nr:hypothetical protein [Pirellulaceae bacterium]